MCALGADLVPQFDVLLGVILFTFPIGISLFFSPEEANFPVLGVQPGRNSPQMPWCCFWQDAAGSWAAVDVMASSACSADVVLMVHSLKPSVFPKRVSTGISSVLSDRTEMAAFL